MTVAKQTPYKEGRAACKANKSADDCPHDSRNGHSHQRQRWFDGYYDQFFFEKYGDPWPSE